MDCLLPELGAGSPLPFPTRRLLIACSPSVSLCCLLRPRTTSEPELQPHTSQVGWASVGVGVGGPSFLFGLSQFLLSMSQLPAGSEQPHGPGHISLLISAALNPCKDPLHGRPPGSFLLTQMPFSMIVSWKMGRQLVSAYMGMNCMLWCGEEASEQCPHSEPPTHQIHCALRADALA